MTGAPSPQFNNRHLLELLNWPEYMEAHFAMEALALGEGLVSQRLKFEVFTIASLTSGCQHCQAHGAFFQFVLGSTPEHIRELWSFETSPDFSEGEKAAFRFAQAASACPPHVEPIHHEDMRAHFSNEEIREIIGAIAFSGLLNRYTQAVVVVTDAMSLQWANENLASVGWQIGKHTGAPEEMRGNYPPT